MSSLGVDTGDTTKSLYEAPRGLKIIDDEILDFLVEINKLRYLPCVDKIQTEFEKGIIRAYKENFGE